MINDLDIDSSLLWKFVDDTTASEIIKKGNVSNAQNLINPVVEWSHDNTQ
jgi:hypothetical protein